MLGKDIVNLARKIFQDIKWTTHAFYRDQPTYVIDSKDNITLLDSGYCLLGSTLLHFGIASHQLEEWSSVGVFCPEISAKKHGVHVDSILNATATPYRLPLNQGTKLILLEELNDESESIEEVLGKLSRDYSEEDFPIESLMNSFLAMQHDKVVQDGIDRVSAQDVVNKISKQ